MRKRPKITEYRFDQWAEDLKSWIQESVSPFEDDTPKKQKERKRRARHDKLYFMKTYLPHYFTAPFGGFHEEWAGLWDLRDECAFVAAPREHAKSTFFTFGDPIHDICYSLRWFILIVSDTNDQATGFTLPVRLEFEDNPRIRHDFGDLVGSTWTKNDFTTRNGVRVLARGRGEKIRGLKNRQHRPDKAIVDDFENDENVKNPKRVKDGRDWLLKAVIGSLGAGYCFLMVGNIFHPKSVLAQFMAEKDEDGELLYLSRIYRAILDPGKPTERPLWPALWPIARLEKKRRMMGTVAFNAEMMNLTGAEESPFREEWFQYYSRVEVLLPKLVVASFVDPSAKQGEANDFKAIITVGLDRERMLFHCLHAWIRHASPGEMFAQAYRQVDQYGGRIGIEENMLEDFLHEAIANYAREAGRYLPWVPVKHTTNKEARIVGTLSYLVEFGKILFEKGHSDQDLLVEQLVYILNANINDDGPDALEGAVSVLQAGAGMIEHRGTGIQRDFRTVDRYCMR
jgi:predicted phage terminase large subunit-like protein